MWRRKQNPTCGKRKREDDENDEKLNSSFQVPSYARITNARVKSGSKVHLLTRPENIRHKIFHFAVVEHDAIVVSTKDLKASKEPGLPMVSHDICKEAIKIFYVENNFDLHVHEFDAAALVPWLEKTLPHRRSTVGKAEPQEEVDFKGEGEQNVNDASTTDTFRPAYLAPTRKDMIKKQQVYHSVHGQTLSFPPGGVSWTIPFEPNWRNLVTWLKLYHAKELFDPPTDKEDSDEEIAAFAVFEVVHSLRGEPWEIVEKILPGLRDMLAAHEARWLWEETVMEDMTN